MAGILDFPDLLRGLLGGQATPQQQPQALYAGANDPFTAATQNFVSSPTVLGGLQNAITGATTGQRTDPVGMYQQMRALTAQVLRQNGVPGPQADLAAIDPEAQKAVLGKLFPTYEAKNVGNTVYTHTPYSPNVNPQFTAPTVSNLGAGEVPSVTYPATPQIGGGIPRPAPIQAQPLAPPTGAQGPTPLGQGPQGGTSTVLPAGPPMTVQEKAAQTAAGTVQGQVLAGLPKLKVNTEMALSLADKMTNHPGAPLALGAASALPTFPGSQQANFRALLEQAKSGVFRQAATELRGLGSLSNTEGSKLESSTARLETTQDPKEFNAALIEYKQYLQKAWTNAQAIARGDMKPYTVEPLSVPSAGSATPTAPTRAPAVASIKALKADPTRAQEFDAFYGPGSAAKVLGGG